MCEVKLPQEDAQHTLAVGHKVLYLGKEATITSIRAVHMGRGKLQMALPEFDLKGDGWGAMNIPFRDLRLMPREEKHD